jgi:predicted regulator of amino acid metabolism with ACT domain
MSEPTKFNLAALAPQLLTALRPGANLVDLAKSMGIEVQQIKVGSEADYYMSLGIAQALRAPEAEVIFITGQPALLNGKKVRILAVLGDFPEGEAIEKKISV